VLNFFIAVGASAVPFAFPTIIVALGVETWLRLRQRGTLGWVFWSALLIGTVVGLLCLSLSLSVRLTAE